MKARTPYEHGHGANWIKWLGHLIGQPVMGMELGTFKGESAEWMLDWVFTHSGSKYMCVDTFEGSAEHRRHHIPVAGLRAETEKRLSRFPSSRWSIIQKPSHEALAEMLVFLTRSFDFIYVDAAHDTLNVLRDGVMSFDLLKVGGVLVFDDYNWHEMPNDLDCPRDAIDAFLHCYSRQIEVLGKGSQVAVRRVRT